MILKINEVRTADYRYVYIQNCLVDALTPAETTTMYYLRKISEWMNGYWPIENVSFTEYEWNKPDDVDAPQKFEELEELVCIKSTSLLEEPHPEKAV